VRSFQRSVGLAVVLVGTVAAAAPPASAAITLRESGSTIFLEDATGSHTTTIGYDDSTSELTFLNTDWSGFGILL
jgi:hypothetical protein